jgi:hypothetical protein
VRGASAGFGQTRRAFPRLRGGRGAQLRLIAVQCRSRSDCERYHRPNTRFVGGRAPVNVGIEGFSFQVGRDRAAGAAPKTREHA